MQALVGQVGTDGLTLAPDAGKFDAVAFAEIEFTDGSPRESAARIQRRIHQRQAFRVEGAEIGRHTCIDLQVLQAAQDIEVGRLPLDHQQVTALQHVVASRHDVQLAVPEHR